MRLPRKPVAVIVMPIFVPTGSFFFLYGLRRSSRDFFLADLNVFFLYGQPFFCAFFFLVLQVTTTLEPGCRFLAARASNLVNFGNASELMLVVDGTTVVGVPPPPPPLGGGAGGPATLRSTRATLELAPRAVAR